MVAVNYDDVQPRERLVNECLRLNPVFPISLAFPMATLSTRLPLVRTHIDIVKCSFIYSASSKLRPKYSVFHRFCTFSDHIFVPINCTFAMIFLHSASIGHEKGTHQSESLPCAVIAASISVIGTVHYWRHPLSSADAVLPLIPTALWHQIPP